MQKYPGEVCGSIQERYAEEIYRQCYTGICMQTFTGKYGAGKCQVGVLNTILETLNMQLHSQKW